MKKFLRTAVAVLLALGLSCTAFAAPSKTNLVEVSSAVDANGNEVEVTVSETSIPLLTETEAAEIIGNILASDVTILTQMDVSVPDGTEFPVTITFSISGITSSDTIYVFHYNGSEWEIVQSSVGENSVTATFNSLSPVAIVKVNDDGTDTGTDTDTGTNTGTDTSTDTGRTSPKTGVNDATIFALAAIVVAGAGVYVFRKKKA